MGNPCAARPEHIRVPLEYGSRVVIGPVNAIASATATATDDACVPNRTSVPTAALIQIQGPPTLEDATRVNSIGPCHNTDSVNGKIMTEADSLVVRRHEKRDLYRKGALQPNNLIRENFIQAFVDWTK